MTSALPQVLSGPAGPRVPGVGVVTLAPQTWHGPWRARQYLMNRLADIFPLVWVEPAREWRRVLAGHARSQPSDGSFAGARASGLMLHDPQWLPRLYRPRLAVDVLERLRLAGAVRLLRRQGCERVVLYLWRPEFAPALDRVAHDLSCYHIDDEYTYSTTEQPTEPAEARLIRRVGQVFIHSPALLQKKGGINPHTLFVPNGVDYEAYATPREEPADLRPIPHPRVGYTGVIKTQMDFALLVALARRHPQWSFVFVGPRGNVGGQESRLAELERLPNVHLLGGRTVGELPAYAQHFDAGMLCYRVDDYTKYIYPLKMHEYLAAGLPVVGSPIRSVLDFAHVVAIADGIEAWSLALDGALQPAARSAERVRARRSVAQAFDWSRHAASIARAICERLSVDPRARLDAAKPSAAL